MPPFCLGLISIVLRLWAAKEVRQSADYFVLFFLIGSVCICVCAKLLLPFFGLDFSIDALECRNNSAITAICGGTIAVTICYAASNIGEGDTIWTTLIPAAWALIALGLLWMSVELIGQFSESITIERDMAAGSHLAGFLIGCSLILGRAVAGDFVSWQDTAIDFGKFGWPVVILAALAVGIQKLCRPTPRMPHPPIFSRGIIPALGHMGAAGAWILATR
jgi:hypothetical protein